MRLPIGVSDFREIIKGKYDFVDKTLLIKDIIDDGAKAILITRPRRFGKTLNISMLYRFFDLNQDPDLFDGLKISEDKEFCVEYQNKFPTIFITFKDVKRESFKSAYLYVIALISDLYKTHRYLLEGNLLLDDEKKIFNDIINREVGELDIEKSVKLLSEYLERKYSKKTIILIDEYDTPIVESYLHNYYTEMVNLIRGMLGFALKDNSSLAKAVLTGITRVSQESMFSGLNNIQVYTLFREKYGQYFGFVETEVIALVHKAGLDVTLEGIKLWYNGYKIGKYTLYNPWSILSCLSNDGELAPYWVNTASNALIKLLLEKADLSVKEAFEDLLQGVAVEKLFAENLVFSDLDKRDDVLWSLLLYAGYLNIISIRRDESEVWATISIPNVEVRGVYKDIVETWFRYSTTLNNYNKFINSLETGDMQVFKAIISSYIMQSGSFFDCNSNTPEAVFHMFVLGMVVGLRDRYIIKSNSEAGFGRFDVAIIPKDTAKRGILLEFKTCEKPEDLGSKATEALKQIKDKKYAEAFANEVKSVLAIGLAFCDKQVEITSEEIILK